MPRPNFHDVLRLGGSKAPPEAGGPIAETQTLEWVWAWIYQNGHHHAAAASGGGRGPFGKDWTVSLKLAQGSDDFKPNRPAQATAIAMVVQDGKKEAYWWSEAVLIRR